jgi:hypothetical protein
LLSAIPGNYPTLISIMTDRQIKENGECNAVTDRSADTFTHGGVAYYGHVAISFPVAWSGDCANGPARLGHEVLCHELSHARECAFHGGLTDHSKLTGRLEGFDIGAAFGEMTEFQAILVTNMLVSETWGRLRFHHNGHALLTSELATSDAYSKAFAPLIARLIARDRSFMFNLASLSSPQFNPLRSYLAVDEFRAKQMMALRPA